MNRKNKRNNRGKPNGKMKHAIVQLSRNINLNSASTFRNLTINGAISMNAVTSEYTFTASSDVRNLSFSTILTNSGEFTAFKSIYSTYRILAVSCTILTNMTNAFQNTDNPTILYMNVEPNIVPALPTNGEVLEADTSKLFNPYDFNLQTCQWRFPTGSGLGTDIWVDVGTNVGVGQLSIGNIPFANSGGVQFEYKIDLITEFKVMK
jgi:hypothetical protein